MLRMESGGEQERACLLPAWSCRSGGSDSHTCQDEVAVVSRSAEQGPLHLESAKKGAQPGAGVVTGSPNLC